MPSAIELKFNTAREVVLAMERTIRIRRLYPSHHARSAEATEDLVAKFLRFFDAHTYLRLSLTDSEILLEDRVLLKNTPVEPYLPFVLWKDGLREIRFHRGISRDEVLEFLGIIGLEPKEVRELGSDYVWLLWTREFSSIDCAAVDEFDPEAGEAPEDPDLAREVREAAEWIERRPGGARGTGGGGGAGGKGKRSGAKGGIAGDGFDEAPARSEFAPAPLAEEFGPETAPPGVEASLVVDLKTIGARVRSMLDADNVGGALHRTVEALKRVPGGMPDEEISEIARGFAVYYTKRKDFCALGHMLKDLAAGESGLGQGRALAAAAEGVPDPVLVGELTEFLNLRYTDDVDGLTRFLDSLGERAGKIICGVYPHIASSRTRGTLAEHLVKRGLGTGDALRGLLQSGDRLLSEVLELLAVVRPAELVRDLTEFTRHPSFAVRVQTIDVLARMDGWERTRVLFSLLEDPDFRIRLHVLRALAGARDPGTILFLMDWISKPEFAARDVEEKAAAFSAFAAIRGNAAIPFLEKQAMVKSPRRAKRLADDTKHGAVTAIRQVASGAARAALERLARDADEPVRSYARMAELGMAALLHDLGKVLHPAKPLTRVHRFSPEEREQLKHSPTFGVRALLKEGPMNEALLKRILVLCEHAAPMHDQMHPFSRIIAVAERFDALTNARPYRKAQLPDVAVAQLLGLKDLDADSVQAFASTVGLYPPGTLVELESGRIAVSFHPSPDAKHYRTPIVRIARDADGEEAKGFPVEDLSSGTDRIRRSLDPARRGIDVPRVLAEAT